MMVTGSVKAILPQTPKTQLADGFKRAKQTCDFFGCCKVGFNSNSFAYLFSFAKASAPYGLLYIHTA